MKFSLAQRSKTWLAALGLCLIGSVAFAAGCGGDSSDNESSSGGGSGETSAEFMSQVDKTLNTAIKNDDFSEPPGNSPPVAPDKSLYLVDFGLEAPVGSQFAEGAEAAADALGWDLTTFDGKLDPNAYQEGINRAIAADADAIMLYVVDCPAVQAPLKQAKDAGLLVVAGESADCSDGGKGPSLFDATSFWKQGDFQETGNYVGDLQASYVIKQTEGEAKTILFNETDLVTTVNQAAASKKKLEECAGCEIVDEVKLTGADFGPPLQAKAEQALLKNPDANSIIVPYDDVYLGGVGAAVKSSGRKDDLTVMAGVGVKPAIEEARNDSGLDAGYGWVVEGQAYQMMDALNRMWNDEEPAKESPFSVGLWDKENLPPEGEAWTPVIDYPAAYSKMWSEAGK